MDSKSAQEVLDGVMLSDGNLAFTGRRAYFSMGLADNGSYRQREQIPLVELLEYLQHLADILGVLGVSPCEGHPKVKPHSTKSSGEWRPGVRLVTRVSDFLAEQYRRWYVGREKIVPEDISLTPISLAYWYMLDGTSKWTASPTILTTLCSFSFNLHGIELLERQLHNLGFNTSRRYQKVEQGSGLAITILQDSVDNFMRTIDPYVVPPFRYKIKYRGSCPYELSGEYKIRSRKQQREYYERVDAKHILAGE